MLHFQEKIQSKIRLLELENSKLITQNEIYLKEIDLLNQLEKKFDRDAIKTIIDKQRSTIDLNNRTVEKNTHNIDGLNGRKIKTVFSISDLLRIPLSGLIYNDRMSTSQTQTKRIAPKNIYMWPNFEENFGRFINTIKSQLKSEHYDFYIFSNSVNIFSHDDVFFQIMTVCNEIFTKRILFNYGQYGFCSCPNREKVKGDIYLNENFFIEVKTPKTLKTTNLIDDYKSGKAFAKKSIEQIFDYMTSSGISFVLLSSYEHTWIFYENNRQLFISPKISNQDLIQAIFYTLVLRENIIDKEAIKNHLNSIKEFKENNKIDLYFDEDCQSDNESQESEKQEEDLGACEYFISNELENEISLKSLYDLIQNSIRDGEVIGYSDSSVVLKVNICNKIYALKMLDLYKQSHYLSDIKNESEILKYLNTKQVICVPTLYFSGIVGIRYCLLMSLIEGKVIEFESMNNLQKQSCVTCLKELHQNYVLHNDFNCYNFIFSGNKAFLIDFGKSILKDDSAESSNDFQNEICSFYKESNQA